MKTFTMALFLCVGVAAIAGEFPNLDFEEARTNNVIFAFDPVLGIYHGFGPTSELMPGWTVYGPVTHTLPPYEDTLELLNWIDFDQENAGPHNISIFDRNGFGRGYPWLVDAVPQGNYALFVRHGGHVPYILSQSGTVPMEAPLLKFVARGGWLDVEVNGQPVTAEPELGSPTGVDWWADLSQWAGQEVTLRLTPRHYMAIPPCTIIDNIRFEPVPEADVGALVAVGGAVLWWWRRRTADPAQCPARQGRRA